ncbi:MAG: alanine racemase [Deltaproteobacteria bacterium]|nr:alanine racemase [Deltaproteobacteria bacterium]
MNHETLAEINLNNLAYNIYAIQQKVFPSKVIPVLKSDAYGHGTVPVTKRLVKEGFKIFSVAQFQEAMELRESGVTQSILILGRLFPGEIPTAIKAGFRITLFGHEDIRWIEEDRQELPAFVHVNVETGMGRIGALFDQEPQFLNDLIQSRYCIWEGLYSHFSTSDEKDKTYANIQLSRFREILSRIQKLGKKTFHYPHG